MNKNKNLAFTLAEVLIVIGIIGVVAALTLPNLNHATGDKETVTRLQKAYSILNEANDRAQAIYGPLSSWKSDCRSHFDICWMNRIGEFLKISKTCNEFDQENYQSCESLYSDNMNNGAIIHQLPDGITFTVPGMWDCDGTSAFNGMMLNDICADLVVDINNAQKGKNIEGQDIFLFKISGEKGIISNEPSTDFNVNASNCMRYKDDDYCTWWVLEYGNLDYLKADESGKCNDSNIILDGVTNTSCH